MKRLLFLCFFIITSSFLRIEASANSAPTYLRGKAASEILFVDKDCPVEVVHENLTFNMNEEINSPKQGLAKVIAEYGMINKENKEINVQMAFPFISKATELNEEDIIVKTQGGKLPYRLLSGKTLEYNHTDKEEEPVNPYDFENILKDINSSNQENKLIKENTVGKLYTVKISQGNEIYAAVSLIYDPLKTKIIARGFNEGTFLPQGSTLTSFY
ncbi:hypothetical protein [Clostridium polynesiense]|uniref:hypothetical protein n=1 Tax=Clostridium polynesiense TaxID=1325933 RepID=UPI00058E226E|nr:hypothetical protein [Clostridium polynesiense]